jgi:hypothetical protein
MESHSQMMTQHIVTLAELQPNPIVLTAECRKGLTASPQRDPPHDQPLHKPIANRTRSRASRA